MLAAPARADVFDDNTAAAALGPGNVYVFVRASDGTIVMRHLSDGVWSDWAPLPGLITGSGPGAAAFHNTVQVFARGQDNTPYQLSIEDGALSGWTALDGRMNSAPAVTPLRGFDQLYLTARGLTNEQFYRRSSPGSATGWAPWFLVPGASNTYTSAPTIVSYTTGRIDIFTRGSDETPWQAYMPLGLGWTGPTHIPGNLDAVQGALGSTTQATGQFDLFSRFPDSTLRRLRYSDANNWDTWAKLDADPTAISSSPAATSDQPGSEYVFARTGDAVSYRVLSGTTWSGWASLGVPAVPVVTPPPVVTPIVTTVVTPVVVTPVAPPKPLGTIKPLLGFSFNAGANSTKFSSLVVKSFPKGSTVTVTCKQGCSAKSLTKRNAKSPLSLKSFIRKPLKAGTVITVVVSRAGSISSVKILTVRARKAPAVKTLCQAPGAKQPRAC